MVALKRLRSSKAVLKRIRSVTAQRATFSASAEPINGKLSGACERRTILSQILCSLRARHQFTANNLVPASAEPIYAVMIPMRHVYHITLRCSPATSHSRNAATPATSHRRNAAMPATSHRRNAAMSATSHRRNAATPATSHRRNTAMPATSHRRNAATPDTSHRRNAAMPATSHRRNAATPATSHRRNAAMPSSGKYKYIHKDELRNCTGSTHMVRSLFILLPPTTSIDWY